MPRRKPSFFYLKNDLRHGNTPIFVVLGKAIREMNIRMHGTIYNRSVQIPAYTDDINGDRIKRDVVERCSVALVEKANGSGL